MWVLVLQTVLLCCLMLFGLTSTLVSALPILLSYYFYLLGWSLSIFLTVLRDSYVVKLDFDFVPSFIFIELRHIISLLAFDFWANLKIFLLVRESSLMWPAGLISILSYYFVIITVCIMIFHDGFLWPFKHFSVFEGLYFFSNAYLWIFFISTYHFS